MYKILAIQIIMVLQILCEESVPQYRTSGTEDLEVIEKEFLAIMKQAVDAAIDHQQKNNASEPLVGPELNELKDMLRTVNGTDLEDLLAQNMDAMRHGRLDVSLADMASIFEKKKQQQLLLQQEADERRERMRQRIDRWVKKKARKAKKKVRMAKKKA